VSKPPKSITWPAEPHTLAKIEIVGKYLFRWVMITGPTFVAQPLTYIDGFAGPGEYTNHPEGSPLAALKALNDAKTQLGPRWKASKIRVMFVEADTQRSAHLSKLLEDRSAAGDVLCVVQNSTFVDGLVEAERRFGKAFLTSAPFVVFIDPFGATGFPWSAVVRILSSKTSEIILNFDADGMARIARAGSDANADEILTTIFGGNEWRAALHGLHDLRSMEFALVDLYKRKLRTLPNVKFTFAFEMASSSSNIDYFLLFASQHSRGLEKMKEAMKEIDQTGTFRFSDAEVGQQRLFKFDTPSDWVPKLMGAFSNKTVGYEEVLVFTLNETPLSNPSKLLYCAQEQGLLTVECDPPRKKKNSFKSDEVKLVRFGGDNA